MTNIFRVPTDNLTESSRSFYREVPIVGQSISASLYSLDGVNYAYVPNLRMAGAYLGINSYGDHFLVDTIVTDENARGLRVSEIETELGVLSHPSSSALNPSKIIRTDAALPTFTTFFPAVHGNLALLHLNLERQPQTPTTLRELLFQVGRQLDVWHRHGRIHGHLKLSDIFYAGERLYLLKLGSDYRKTWHFSDFPYSPPEALTGAKCSSASDCWALGIICLQLLGFQPFDPKIFGVDESYQAPRIDVRRAFIEFEKLRLDMATTEISDDWRAHWIPMLDAVDKLPEPLPELLRGLLAYEPATRLDATAVCRMLPRRLGTNAGVTMWLHPCDAEAIVLTSKLNELDAYMLEIQKLWPAKHLSRAMKGVLVGLLAGASVTGLMMGFINVPLLHLAGGYATSSISGTVAGLATGYGWWRHKTPVPARAPSTSLGLWERSASSFDRAARAMVYRTAQRDPDTLFALQIVMLSDEPMVPRLLREMTERGRTLLESINGIDPNFEAAATSFQSTVDALMMQPANHQSQRQLDNASAFLVKLLGPSTSVAELQRSARRGFRRFAVDKTQHLPLNSFQTEKAVALATCLNKVSEVTKHDDLAALLIGRGRAAIGGIESLRPPLLLGE